MQARVTCVVPARLGSTRFFGKLLQPLSGKPVVVHALDRAVAAGCFDTVVCLTDSQEIGAALAEHGYDFIITGEASNGTERIARALDVLQGDLFVNLQGDEPAFPEDGLRTLCAAIRREPGFVHLLVHEGAPSPEELADPNRVKAMVDREGSVTGLVRDIGAAGELHSARTGEACLAPTVGGGMKYRLQLGAYAYSRDYLAQYAALPPSADEITLSHEILRAPELAPLRAHASAPGASVDVPADLDAALDALEALRAHKNLKAPNTLKTTANTQRQQSLQGIPT